MRVTIMRLEHGLSECLGVLLLDGCLWCYTLEKPWRDNRNDISCIPEGYYICEKYDSMDHGPSFQVKNVPGRSHIILGHIGNTAKDTTGCILFGNIPGRIDADRAVMNSRKTMAAWEVATHGIDVLTLGIWSVKL